MLRSFLKIVTGWAVCCPTSLLQSPTTSALEISRPVKLWLASSSRSSVFVPPYESKSWSQGPPRQTEDHLSTMGRFLSHGALPSIEVLINNAAAQARSILTELREKATARIKTASVRTSLKEGSLFATSLFHLDAVKKAEDCCKMAPPPITVLATQPAPQQYYPTKIKSNHANKSQPNSSKQSFQGKGSSRTASSSYCPAANSRGKGNKESYKPAPTKGGNAWASSKKKGSRQWSSAPPPKGSHQEVALQASDTLTASCFNVPQQSLAPSYPLNFKWCHQGVPTPTLLPKQNLHSAKTPGRKAPYHRPFSLKPTHSMPLFQDDGRQQDQARHPQTAFLHLPRHLRRLSPYPDSSKIPEIRFLLHPGSSLLLSGHAFRSQPWPPNLHYRHHPSSENASFPGDLRLFPPPALIPLCLRKLHESDGHGIFVAPSLPAAPWWPQLLAIRSLLDIHLQVFQSVHGVLHSAQEETCLRFLAATGRSITRRGSQIFYSLSIWNLLEILSTVASPTASRSSFQRPYPFFSTLPLNL